MTDAKSRVRRFDATNFPEVDAWATDILDHIDGNVRRGGAFLTEEAVLAYDLLKAVQFIAREMVKPNA